MCYDRYDESIKLNQECLERSKIIFGENHYNTLQVMYNVGLNYELMGNVDDALTFFQECYDRRFILLGKDHPDTLQCVENLNFIENY